MSRGCNFLLFLPHNYYAECQIRVTLCPIYDYVCCNGFDVKWNIKNSENEFIRAVKEGKYRFQHGGKLCTQWFSLPNKARRFRNPIW